MLERTLMPIKPSPLTYLFLFDHALDQIGSDAKMHSGVNQKRSKSINVPQLA